MNKMSRYVAKRSKQDFYILKEKKVIMKLKIQ